MRRFTGILVALTLFLLTVTTVSGSPFRGTEPQGPPSFSDNITRTITIWQFQIRKSLSTHLRKAANGETAPLLFLAGMALLYGVIHAAGPGHGKAVAAAYLLHGGKRLSDGLLFGNLIALFHGLSGIILVVALKFLLETKTTIALAKTTQLTSVVSLSLILLLGGILFCSGIFRFFRPPSSQPAGRLNRFRGGPVLSALVVGIIPCPGVVTVMLFATGLGMAGLGMLMAGCMIMGMALTISLILLLVVLGRNQLARQDRRFPRLPGLITMVSGLLLILLAATFLFSHTGPARF